MLRYGFRFLMIGGLSVDFYQRWRFFEFMDSPNSLNSSNNPSSKIFHGTITSPRPVIFNNIKYIAFKFPETNIFQFKKEQYNDELHTDKLQTLNTNYKVKYYLPISNIHYNHYNSHTSQQQELLVKNQNYVYIYGKKINNTIYAFSIGTMEEVTKDIRQQEYHIYNANTFNYLTGILLATSKKFMPIMIIPNICGFVFFNKEYIFNPKLAKNIN